MKFLLTSGGVRNAVIAQAFQKLIDKPFSETKVAFVPTGAFAEEGDKDWFVNDLYNLQALGVHIDFVELAQLSPEEVMQRVKGADVIFVNGGNTFYLSYWMQQSGLMDALPELLKTRVYAGTSAGSMIVGPSLRIAAQMRGHGMLDEHNATSFGPAGKTSDKVANLVPVMVRPHYGTPDFAYLTPELMQQDANEQGSPVYALDDQSAVSIVDGAIEVASEGEWRAFEPDKAK